MTPQNPKDAPHLGTGDIAVIHDTKSLSSSILRYTWENGRRYHAYRDGSYWGPNDERQLDTEDFMHSMFLTILDGRLYIAPIGNNPQRVLDVGCGTEFAQQHESAEVYGVDLSPVQPNMVPVNVKFEVDDINLDWTYPKNHFDFVHIRLLTGSIPSWPGFHRKVLKHLSPGGWVQQIELGMETKSDDGTVTPDMPFSKWEHVFTVAGEQMGKTFLASDIIADAMRQAGFQNVNEMRLKLPIGRWPKHETLKIWGTWCRAFLTDGLEGFGLRMMTGVLGWTYEETQAFLADMKRHLMDPKIHGYVEMVVAYGQKPSGTTEA
ncbi:S-adenosyl-L-methionine-dependent methyltransferase [Dactylonectria macrodidyma]|uniref:S-adenosyl-L-methionine-dependent methyltransferase n=1 Tax=Dactylonectria macrodidyma TaxID=307937 RepID=A0A9P9JFV3_9HYPO|nr:S-adenosyl-L-methionine-dependent methyltransferase [Dactylonectria macrodidyma]